MRQYKLCIQNDNNNNNNKMKKNHQKGQEAIFVGRKGERWREDKFYFYFFSFCFFLRSTKIGP